jgi:hypothetical protein
MLLNNHIKRIVFFTLLILSVTYRGNAQQNFIYPPAIEWKKCFGGSNEDVARCIQQTADSGYIIAGNSNSNDFNVSGNHKNSTDYWIIKLRKDGKTIEWQRSLGGKFYEVAHYIIQTKDGGYIIAGETSSNTGNVSGNNGLVDCWIVKLFR